MSVPEDRPQPGPGAPLTAERESYRRLMAQGLNAHQACLQIGWPPSTGMRWRKGRNMVDSTARSRDRAATAVVTGKPQWRGEVTRSLAVRRCRGRWSTAGS
jgi:hypothetical protein